MSTAIPVPPSVRGRGDGRERDWKQTTNATIYTTMLRPGQGPLQAWEGACIPEACLHPSPGQPTSDFPFSCCAAKHSCSNTHHITGLF